MQQDPQPRVLRSAHLTYDVPAAVHNRVIAAPDFPFPFDVPGVQVKMRPHAKPSDRARSVIELLSSDEEPAKNRVNRKANRDSETEDDQFEILDHRVNGIPKTIQEMPTFKRAPRLGRRIAGGSKPNGLVTAIRKRPAPVKDEPLPDIGPSKALQTAARDTVAADEAGVGILGGDDDEYNPGIKATFQQRGSHNQAEPTRRRPGKYKPLFDALDSDGELAIPQLERKSAIGRTNSRTSSQKGQAGSQRARGIQVDEAETTAKDVFEAAAFDGMGDMKKPMKFQVEFLEALLKDTEEGEGVQADELKSAGPVMPVVAADPESEEQVALPAIAEPPEEPSPPVILGIDDIGHLVQLIISLIPDVCPDHLDEVIRGQIFADPGRRVSAEDACTEVITQLFDTDLAAYPKAKDKKRKVEAEAGPSDPKKRKMGDESGVGVQGRPDDGEAEFLTNGRFNYKSEKARTAERQGWGYRKCTAKDLQNLFPEMTTKQ